MCRGIRAEYRRDNANRPHAIYPNDINRPRAIHPNEINLPHVICPNETNYPCVICPNGINIQRTTSNETVGAAPACPPERPCSDVSIPKIHTLCAGILTMDVPLWGDTGGHIGTAPTNLHHIFPRNLTQTK